MKRRQAKASTGRRPQPSFTPSKLRIIAGALGGRKFEYNGDPATRPMKDRTREAVFSLLGGYLYNTFAVDLFGGTGVLAFESISRGAVGGVIFELSRTTLSTIIENMQFLGLGEHLEVHNVDTLRWFKSLPASTQDWPAIPWVVFCCPPYRLWTNEPTRLAEGIQELYDLAPVGSQFVCETDDQFDVRASIPGIDWDLREYKPAFVGVAQKL